MLLCAALASCTPTPPMPTADAPRFPTVTPGRVLRAPVPPPDSGALDLGAPAAALAAARLPSATPDLATCPAPDESLTLPASAPPAPLLDSAIIGFLSDGGTLVALEGGLRGWGAIDADGGARGDLDLTGEGTNEFIVLYRTGDEGVLLIVGCVNGRAIDRYRVTLSESIPQIIGANDANADGVPDLLFAARSCPAGETCVYQAQMVTWERDRGRFVNLISDALVNAEPPTLEDIDDDRIDEIIARTSGTGDATSGPIRTGYTVWDWDGSSYVRTITQLDPPRYRIQALHAADSALEAASYDEAIALYLRAVDDPALEDWLPDDALTLRAYALYRLLIAYAASDDPRADAVQARLIVDYPDLNAAPPYAAMGLEFWNGFTVTGSISAGCGEAREVAAARLDAVGLLNRYGAESPLYTTAALCPF